ncbi:MAG: hypothetical protein HY791_23190 [Deltaproteobacteria bacterium]|nr:hypothetical protein [Deltaproteobacteria bacterium]
MAVVENWFIAEPLLFGVWTTHKLTVSPRVENIRSGRGEIEYNPDFIDSLGDSQLRDVLRFEAMRILLKHPYLRRKEDPILSYQASNVTLQEYLSTTLPHPRAVDLFGTHDFDLQYFERYYALLSEMSRKGRGASQRKESEATRAGATAQLKGKSDSDLGDFDASSADSLDGYVSADQSGPQNTESWQEDDFLVERVDDKIREAAESSSFGSFSGQAKGLILATLRPRLDYRAVLKRFRRSILSTERRLTRMRPNRRYGFDYLGSTYERATKLLFAVDVSGSMSELDIAKGFSIINRFFKVGIQQVDVLTFDAQLTSSVTTLKKARFEVKITGRGGTNFQPVLDYVDEHRGYDGLIVYTDGVAPAPKPLRRTSTSVLWMIHSESAYASACKSLSPVGRVTFVRPSSDDEKAKARKGGA